MARVVTASRSIGKATIKLQVSIGILFGCILASLWLFDWDGPILFMAGIMATIAWRLGKQVKSLQGGRKGEAVVASVLENLPDGYVVVNDVWVSHGKRRCQIDHLVMGPSGVFVIEDKNWKGEVTGRVDDREWLQRKSDTVVRLPNPIRQAASHAYTVRGLLNKNALRVFGDPGAAKTLWVQPVVVSAHPAGRFHVDDCPIPLLTPRDLVPYLTTQTPKLPIENDAVQKILRLIAPNTLTASPREEAAGQ